MDAHVSADILLVDQLLEVPLDLEQLTVGSSPGQILVKVQELHSVVGL